MTNYAVDPFDMTPEFVDAWNAAGEHLDPRIADVGASWLRADLPAFREHLSFALGNQLFFVQLTDQDAPDNGWSHPERLAMAVKDADGVGCLLPMHRRDGRWAPTGAGWGLVDPVSEAPIDPVSLLTDEPVLMTDWEVHDVGVQAVRSHLENAGWTIASWQTDLQVDPSVFAHKDGRMCGFVVRTSDVGPDPAQPPENAARVAEALRARGWGAKFVGLKIASAEDPTHTDPRLQHLRRRIRRRSPLMISRVEPEEL